MNRSQIARLLILLTTIPLGASAMQPVGVSPMDSPGVAPGIGGTPGQPAPGSPAGGVVGAGTNDFSDTVASCWVTAPLTQQTPANTLIPIVLIYVGGDLDAALNLLKTDETKVSEQRQFVPLGCQAPTDEKTLCKIFKGVLNSQDFSTTIKEKCQNLLTPPAPTASAATGTALIIPQISPVAG